jgi:hypothetical protein
VTAAPENQGCFTTTKALRPDLHLVPFGTPLWLTFLLVLVAGCQSTPSGATNPNQVETGSGEIRSEKTLWSPTLHWAGARFRFELHAEEKNQKPQIERRQNTDILRVGDLEVELVRTRFRIAGVMYRWASDSIIWIHKPPHPGRPFFRQEGLLQLTWVGNGVNPVVEEQRADGSFIWTIGPARITREADGTVQYKGRSRDQTRVGPWKMLLDSAGRLIGGTS